MKTFLLFLFFLLGFFYLRAQITTPIIKANFGVDGELRANYFNNFVQSGNDDWFNMNTAGTGQFVIDTTGAAAITAAYITNPASRQLPFYRTMRYPPFTVVNNRLLIDAVFTRDYHGKDSTIFASGGNKNGDSPADWTCPVAQSIPDKNEILDMMVHIRRAGPNLTDSLWMFGGISIENTSGDRYVDFEMYQTDIYYDRGPQRFFGYGPNAGHTIWRFAANGDITAAGDIIFTAEFGATLKAVEARIWVDKASLLMTPLDFDWSGSFDGAFAGAQYGYAGIQPKTAGAFYSGLPCINNTWGGPFQIVLGDNSIVNNYTTTQFLEFGVNLSKIGLDPVNLLGGNACNMPFRRVLVKSRASSSFTAELKDFVGPFDFFIPAKAKVFADIPVFCGVYGVSNLQVSNPVANAVYTWTTSDGHISGTNIGTSIFVDSAGTYVVSQQLQTSCPTYATDTFVVKFDATCIVLEANIVSLTGIQNKQNVQLDWHVLSNENIKFFQLERSTDGIHFTLADSSIRGTGQPGSADYSMLDNIENVSSPVLYYRLKMVNGDKKGSYSKMIRIEISSDMQPWVSISPNPASDKARISIYSKKDNVVQVLLYDFSGRLTRSMTTQVRSGKSLIDINDLKKLERGVYAVKIMMGNKSAVEKVVLKK